MNNKPQHTNSEEEIEIGSLFNQIAKFYFYILNNIKGLFRGILYGIIFLLVHLKKNFVVIGSFTALTTIIAAAVIFSSERSYTSSMTVKPHYESTKLLYESIDYYNNLLIQHDTVLLAKILDCPTSITSKISEITIQPLTTKAQTIEIINGYYQIMDSSLLETSTLNLNLVEEIDPYDYELHTISVSALGDFDFSLMEEIILNKISKSTYFIQRQEKNRSQHLEMKQALLSSIYKMDTLSQIFNTVIVETSKKPIIASPNPLFEKERKSDLKDIKWVFDEYTRLNNELSFVNVKLSFIEKPVTVITSFNSRGVKEPRLIIVLLSTLAGFIFAIVCLLIKNLISYLNRVEKDYI